MRYFLQISLLAMSLRSVMSLTSCAADLARAGIITNENKLPYALIMEDASGKLPSGVFQGNTVATGSFDECYDHVSESDLGYGVSFVGVQINVTAVLEHMILTNQTVPPILYSLVAYKPSVGVCAPTSCASNDEIVTVLKIFSGDAIPASAVESKILPRNEPISTVGGITIGVCCVILILSILGAIYTEGGISGCFRLRKEKNESTCKKILKAFSLTENLEILTNLTQRFPVTSSLEGMRVLSMQWVILGHTLLVLASGNIDNTSSLFLDVAKRFSMQPIVNATVSVDTFFVISGFLLAYVSLRKLRKIFAKKSSPPSFTDSIKIVLSFTFHRWLRIVPVLGLVMIANAELLPSIGNGPLWHGRDLGKACRKYWWTNLLFINNFHPKNLMDECIGQSWYLGCDFQFFILGVILLVLFQSSPRLNRFRYLILGLISVASVILRMVVTYQHHLPAQGQLYGAHKEGSPVYNSSPENLSTTDDYKNYAYVQPQYRISTYLIGMILGMILDDIEQRRLKPVQQKPRGASRNRYESISASLMEHGAEDVMDARMRKGTSDSTTDPDLMIRATSSGTGVMEYVPLDKEEKEIVKQQEQLKLKRKLTESKVEVEDEDEDVESACTLEFTYYAGAIVALGIMVAVLFGLYGSYHGHPTDMTRNIFYVGLNRVAWSLAVAYFIFCCATGRLTFVNKLLSLPIFLPLSKLSYSCYLLHIFVLEVVTGVHRVLYHYTDYTFVSLYLLTLCITYATAACLFVMVELPAAKIEALLLGKA